MAKGTTKHVSVSSKDPDQPNLSVKEETSTENETNQDNADNENIPGGGTDTDASEIDRGEEANEASNEPVEGDDNSANEEQVTLGEQDPEYPEVDEPVAQKHDPDADTSVVTEPAGHEPQIGSQGGEHEGDFYPANAKGHRIAMMNDRGNITIIDDDTALILYENPSFYTELYDSDRKTHIPTRLFRWVDESMQPTGLIVGEPYEKVE